MPLLSDRVKRWSLLGPSRVLPRPLRVAVRHHGLWQLELGRARRAGLIIVGHPKSGNTWLRTMLSRLYQVRAGAPSDFTVKTDELALAYPGAPRILATNGEYSYEGAIGGVLDESSPDSVYKQKPVVFLARHPGDIAVSWYVQFTKRQSVYKQELINAFIEHPIDRTSIERWEFVRHSDIGLPFLIDFLNTWERRVSKLRNGIVVRYEDLRADPVPELRRITRLMGEDCSDEELEAVATWGSFDNLRQARGAGHVQARRHPDRRQGRPRLAQGPARQGRWLPRRLPCGPGRGARPPDRRAALAEPRLCEGGGRVTYIDYDRLLALDPAEYRSQKPYPYVNPQGILRPEAFETLTRNLPDLSLFDESFGVERKAGQAPHDRYTLEYRQGLAVPEPWREFIEELIAPRYRNHLCTLAGTRNLEFNFHWHFAPAGASVSPHCDSKRKLGSHIFYLNTREDWDPEWGGETVVLDDGGRFETRSAPGFEDFDEAIPAETMDNRSFLFTRQGNSWHGVRAITCPEGHFRRVFIVVINRADPIARVRKLFASKSFERF